MRLARLLLFALLFFFCADAAQAQRKKFTQAFDKGMFTVDAHTSLGLYRSRQFLSSRMPVFVGADYGVRSDVGVGVLVGWNQRMFKDPGAPPYNVNYYYYGIRLGMHLTRFINQNTPFRLNPNHVDTYISVFAARQVASQVTFSAGGIENSGSVNLIGGVVGARLYTMNYVGALIELGAGPYGLVNAGICAKF